MTAQDSRTVLERLDASLAMLEAAVARIVEAERSRADLSDALAAMDMDRQGLAESLDVTLARANRLQAANEAVEARLSAVGARLDALLGGASDS